ncbi:MAG: hypothetical protein RR356_03050 [Bacteroidales bacterium]
MRERLQRHPAVAPEGKWKGFAKGKIVNDISSYQPRSQEGQRGVQWKTRRRSRHAQKIHKINL